MASVIVKQAIANDQESVADAVNTLLINNSVDSAHFMRCDVTEFGANQFAVVVTYHG